MIGSCQGVGKISKMYFQRSDHYKSDDFSGERYTWK